MKADIGQAGVAFADFGVIRPALRKLIPGAVVIAGLAAFAAPPVSAAPESLPAGIQAVADVADLPSLGRHVRRAARLPFNVSLQFEDEDMTAAPASRPSLARFVRARGHGSEASAVDNLGPDRLVESLTFPPGSPLSQPKGTALADVNNAAKGAPGL
jgi:hypothetical protein